MNDRQLLRQFTQHNSQEAFTALTARYLSLVYSTCRRELNDADLAEDVTQAVFLILARKAPSLRREVVLSGWLFQTARFAARNARLQEQRRKATEQKAAGILREQQMETEDAAWTDIEPLLNQSLAGLRDAERECVLLRFFQGMTFAEAGTALGLSEDAARKRVTRALDKMRQFFVKNGVIVPSTALAVLLTAHAAKAAPISLVPAIAQSTAGVFAGHATTAALTGSHVYQLSEGVIKAMKIVQIKMVAGIAALVIAGTVGTYDIVRSAASSAAQEDLTKRLLADSVPSQFRTVALTGRVRRANGAPVGRVHLCAKIQDADEMKLFDGQSRLATSREQEISAILADAKPDGTYRFYVGDGIKYNIFIFRFQEDFMKSNEPDTGVVAAAAEGVSGAKGATVSVPDLVLTPGGIVTGTVTDKMTGLPIAGATVMGYGPQSPQSTKGTFLTQTDSTGTYRLRVAPGKIRVYVADMVNTQSGLDTGHYLEIAEGETKTQDFQVMLKRSLFRSL